MISGLPSSGTDWLARCMVEGLGLDQDQYYREWFNPLCNWSRADDLAKRGFGSESPHAIRGVGRRLESDVTDLVQKFTDSGLLLDKEVWMAGKALDMKEHFHIIGLTRDLEDTFPPKRARVLNWFQWVQTVANPNVEEDRSFMQTARSGYRWLQEVHRLDCHTAEVPLLNWGDLVNEHNPFAMTAMIEVALPPHLSEYAERVAQVIIRTRKLKTE